MLLAEHRGVRNRKRLPPLTKGQILAWADSYFQRTGSWPTANSGPITDAPGETWMAAQVALRNGQRGLPGGSSLALLLAERRGVRHRRNRPTFSIEEILRCADAFHERTGNWPHVQSGPIHKLPGECWSAVDRALRRGMRGLPGGSSLANLLADERGVRNPANLPDLSRKQILAWAKAHYRSTGQWPNDSSGRITEAPNENWGSVGQCMRQGTRGLRAGSTLARLLAEHGCKQHLRERPRLSNLTQRIAGFIARFFVAAFAEETRSARPAASAAVVGRANSMLGERALRAYR